MVLTAPRSSLLCGRRGCRIATFRLVCRPLTASEADMDSTDLALTKFGVGQPVPRKEDPTLLRGQGRYTDDVNLAGQAHAVTVRSRIAHGTIGAIDADAARAMPGVVGVFTAADL